MHTGEVRRIGRFGLNRNNNETQEENNRRKLSVGNARRSPQDTGNVLACTPKRYPFAGVLRHGPIHNWTAGLPYVFRIRNVHIRPLPVKRSSITRQLTLQAI